MIKELKKLENSKIDRIYHTKENHEDLLIIVHVSGIGKHIIKVSLPSMIYMDYSKEEQGVATGLCMMLRKYLEGSILTGIEQINFERIIVLTFQRKEEKYFLIIELFSKGNIIFCDKDKKILNLLNTQKWRDREIKKDAIYVQPKFVDIKTINEDELENIIKNSNKQNLVKILAIELGLGGVYAEELCERIQIDKESRNVEPKKIISGIKELLSKDIHANSNNGKAFPFELKTIKPEKYYETFSEAIAKNIETRDIEQELYDKQKHKITLIIDEQTKILEQTEREAKEYQEKADKIYKKYLELDSIIKTIKDARKKYGWKEIKKIIQEDKKFSKIILDINEKNGTITVELDEL